jgi:hypothetical protein
MHVRNCRVLYYKEIHRTYFKKLRCDCDWSVKKSPGKWPTSTQILKLKELPYMHKIQRYSVLWIMATYSVAPPPAFASWSCRPMMANWLMDLKLTPLKCLFTTVNTSINQIKSELDISTQLYSLVTKTSILFPFWDQVYQDNIKVTEIKTVYWFSFIQSCSITLLIL